jgi:hypothetical protein
MLGIASLQTTVIACAVSAAAAFGGAWTVQGWRYGEQIAGIRLEQAVDLVKQSDLALEDFTAMQRTKDDAIIQAEHRAQINAQAAARAATNADRLRSDLAKANARISTAARAAVDQYAATVTDVFGQCVQEYRGMAEKATGHASDVKLMHDAWPSNK